jgi:hypothetical protein
VQFEISQGRRCQTVLIANTSFELRYQTPFSVKQWDWGPQVTSKDKGAATEKCIAVVEANAILQSQRTKGIPISNLISPLTPNGDATTGKNLSSEDDDAAAVVGQAIDFETIGLFSLTKSLLLLPQRR